MPVQASSLIVVAGVIGPVASTTASFIARQLRQNGVPARYIFKGGHRHPTRDCPTCRAHSHPGSS